MVGSTGLKPARMSAVKGRPLEPLCALPDGAGDGNRTRCNLIDSQIPNRRGSSAWRKVDESNAEPLPAPTVFQTARAPCTVPSDRTTVVSIHTPCGAACFQDRLHGRVHIALAEDLGVEPERSSRPHVSSRHAARRRAGTLQRWSRWSDSNRLPAMYETAALPDELHRRGDDGANRTRS